MNDTWDSHAAFIVMILLGILIMLMKYNRCNSYCKILNIVQKTTQHDFDNDPITLLRTEDGEWIEANGTTLGSDNGIGVCTGLALAADKDTIHGPMELLLTIDEETGMTGVMALTPDFCTAKYLLNLDAEELGAFYVGMYRSHAVFILNDFL